MAKIVDLIIDQGGAYQHVFSYKDIDDDSVVPLTSYTGKFDFKDTYGGTILFSGTSVGGQLVIDGALGTVTMDLSDEETEAFAFTEGIYDIELESPAGRKFRFVEGALTIMPEVTTS